MKLLLATISAKIGAYEKASALLQTARGMAPGRSQLLMQSQHTRARSPKVNYGRYLASREWALLKRELRERSDSTCERCHFRPYQETHHLSYERLGNERLEDLLAVCTPCHKYLSAVTDFDPAKCDCDPAKAWDWVELVADDPALHEAALEHWREVLDAYAK